MSLLRGGRSVVPFFRRMGPVLAIVGAAVAVLTWPRAYDLECYLGAAKLLAAGSDPYAGTRAIGIEQWGQGKTFLSPPPVAQVLAPFSGLPEDVLFVAWVTVSLVVLLAAMRLVTRDTLVARAPMVVFSFVYVMGSIWIGQVNLLALAGLLLAFGCRNERLAGVGLALAIVTRATPVAFAVVLLMERRWRALGWCAVLLALLVLTDPSAWQSYIALLRDAAAVPTQPVLIQASLAPWPVLWVAAAVAVGVVVIIAALVPRDRALLAGTAIGFAMVILPSNSWSHWLSFAMAPLFLFGDGSPWSRVALLLFVVVSIPPIGIMSSAVALGTLLVMAFVSARNLRDARPLMRPKAIGILGRP